MRSESTKIVLKQEEKRYKKNRNICRKNTITKKFLPNNKHF